LQPKAARNKAKSREAFSGKLSLKPIDLWPPLQIKILVFIIGVRNPVPGGTRHGEKYF
jgi:hypothetical protein